MKARYGDDTESMEADGGPQPADLAPEAARGAAQAAARAAALQRFVATTQAAHVYPQARPSRAARYACRAHADVASQLAAAVAEYEAAVGVSLQVRVGPVAHLTSAVASATRARVIGPPARQLPACRGDARDAFAASPI
jgi:hypothetical protein